MLLIFVLAVSAWALKATGSDFRFVIIGDRTGEALEGVYQQVWRDAAADHPAFAITVGDTIQGLDDATVNAEWLAALRLIHRYSRFPVYFTPGNHDVWSTESAEAYQRYTRHPLHYSFDYRQAHFTILDEHENDPLKPLAVAEFDFLKQDLQSHAEQPLKFVFSHTPFWLVNAALKNPDSELARLARRYGVHFIIAGHLHQMLRFNAGNDLYLSVPSSGGHLREDKRYERGWFFAHILVDVHGDDVQFTIKETGPPFGEGRITHPSDWGALGLERSAK